MKTEKGMAKMKASTVKTMQTMGEDLKTATMVVVAAAVAVAVAVFVGGGASVDGDRVVVADDSVGNGAKVSDRRETKRRGEKDQKKVHS